ncbi:ATP-binding protein [Cryobacterium sp. Y11]|uniref:ATP-binding protein n=1 Tax=Cryobacterium sp. Y11 TaxID=2045016 RepID=UPI000CE3B38B|nr:ATP-binding protein [Cryobacterium sp. Y11]
MNLLNPYTPGAGTRPTLLAGRGTQTALLRNLADQVEAGRTGNPIVYIGLRGMGKTSLMYAARDLLRERGWLAGYFEVRRNVEPGVAVQTIIADSAQLSTGKLRAALAAGGHRIGGMKLTLSPAGFSFEIDTDKRTANPVADPFPALVAFLRALGADARANGVGVALLIDELQLFRKRDLAVLIQALSALEDEPIVLIGAGLPGLPADMAKANTYAERFRFEGIGPLHDPDAKEAVVGPAFGQGILWDAHAVSSLITSAQGYPYFLQLYASEAWIAADGAPTITPEHLEASTNAAQRQLNVGLYTARYDRLSGREREYVDALAALMPSNVDRVGSSDVAHKLGKTLSVVAPVRDRVIKKGIVHSPAFGMLEFSVPGFASYVVARSTTADL